MTTAPNQFGTNPTPQPIPNVNWSQYAGQSRPPSRFFPPPPFNPIDDGSGMVNPNARPAGWTPQRVMPPVQVPQMPGWAGYLSFLQSMRSGTQSPQFNPNPGMTPIPPQTFPTPGTGMGSPPWYQLMQQKFGGGPPIGM